MVGNIIRRISKIKNVSSQEVSKIISSEKENVYEKPVLVLGEEMPNLKGLSPKEVMTLFQETNYDIHIKGTGLVVQQEPAAGKSLEGIHKIEVILE